jgi:hypothetical protein
VNWPARSRTSNRNADALVEIYQQVAGLRLAVPARTAPAKEPHCSPLVTTGELLARLECGNGRVVVDDLDPVGVPEQVEGISA